MLSVSSLIARNLSVSFSKNQIKKMVKVAVLGAAGKESLNKR